MAGRTARCSGWPRAGCDRRKSVRHELTEVTEKNKPRITRIDADTPNNRKTEHGRLKTRYPSRVSHSSTGRMRRGRLAGRARVRTQAVCSDPLLAFLRLTRPAPRCARLECEAGDAPCSVCSASSVVKTVLAPICMRACQFSGGSLPRIRRWPSTRRESRPRAGRRRPRRSPASRGRSARCGSTSRPRAPARARGGPGWSGTRRLPRSRTE